MRALIAIFACSGCLVHPPLTGPAAGGAVWRELKSAHVVMRTDLEESSARSALDDFEVSAMRLGALLSTELPQDQQVRVALFGDERDYRELAGEDWSGGAYHNQGGDGIIAIFLRDNWVYMRPVVREVWQHEYTHALVHRALPNAPVWFNEGLAKLFESVRAEEELRRLAVGRVMSQVPPREWPAVSELIKADASEFYRNRERYYAGAWGVIYYLFRHQRAAFGRLFAALRTDSSPAAWQTAEIDPQVLEQQMMTEFSHDVPREWVIDDPPWPPHADPEAVRTLSDAEVHLLWAGVCDFSRADGRKRARAQLEAARRSEPDSAEAKRLSEMLDPLEPHQ